MAAKVYTVQISKYIENKCKEFSEEVLESCFSHYKKRSATCSDKVKYDIFIGKIGEWGVYRLLKDNNIDATKPDMKIHLVRNKSFDADLMTDSMFIHCKSQSAASQRRYGKSWILQYSGLGKGHQDKLFRYHSNSDYLAPSSVREEDDFTYVDIYGIIKVRNLFDLDMIKEPKSAWFKDTKRAIYWDDLKTLSHYRRWGALK